MGCGCGGGMKGVPRTRVVTPSQLAARRNALTSVSNNSVLTETAASAAPEFVAQSMTKSMVGMNAERRLVEKKRRDSLRNKLGR